MVFDRIQPLYDNYLSPSPMDTVVRLLDDPEVNLAASRLRRRSLVLAALLSALVSLVLVAEVISFIPSLIVGSALVLATFARTARGLVSPIDRAWAVTRLSEIVVLVLAVTQVLAAQDLLAIVLGAALVTAIAVRSAVSARSRAFDALVQTMGEAAKRV